MRPMASHLSATQQGLGFEYDEGHTDQSITALAGIPLLVQAFRSLGLPARCSGMCRSNGESEAMTRRRT